MAKTKIQWATDVWNPLTGCDPVSAGCDNCYARRMVKRLQANPRTAHKYRNGFKVTCHPEELEKPLDWGKPRMVFVSSMGDLFHKDVPFDFIEEVWSTMCLADHHIYIILTKRPERMLEAAKHFCWIEVPHIWFGVSVESQDQDHRIAELLKVPAAVRVVSYEPAIGGLDMWKWFWEDNPNYQPPRFLDEGETYTEPHEIPSNKIGWVICGGETGPGARPMNPEWARAVKNQCVEAGVPFFFKSWGEYVPAYHCDSRYSYPVPVLARKRRLFEDGGEVGWVGKKQAGRLLDGKEYNEIPEV